MRQLIFGGFLIIFTSCATEKINSSPIVGNFYSDAKTAENSYDISKKMFGSIKDNINASEISNLISTFPSFKDKDLMKEIQNLKYSLQNYLFAIDAGNHSGKVRNFQNIEKSYKKIQKLRTKLNYDDNELLNRYLVKIKTNVTLIEESLSSNKK